MWKKCSQCKKDIGFASNYYVCSVSTCNGLRTGYVFCSIPCWDAHVPGAGHRSAGAVEKTAPREGQSGEVRRIVSSSPGQSGSSVSGSAASAGNSMSANRNALPRDVLIVASKLKDYIKAKADMNTSAAVMDVLSDWVRIQCDNAIETARREGRKTVLDRDFRP